MTDIFKYGPGDLAVVVRPLQRAPQVLSGAMTWKDAVSGPDTGWAMAAEKAEKVRVLLAAHEDVIKGAWRVARVTHHSEVPEGKTRPVNRSHFETVDDERLAFLIGTRSPKRLPRNPQGVVQLRDLPGADLLLSADQAPRYGVIRLGAYTLTVERDGAAELRIPVNAQLAIRTNT